MTGSESLKAITFIFLPNDFTIPENLDFIDKKIPLPVQKATMYQDEIDLTNLSWEQILAGMLTIFAYEPNHDNADYYRKVLLAVKPHIKEELLQAAIIKIRNEDYDIAEEIFAALQGLDPADMAIVLNMAFFYDQRGTSYRKSTLIEDAQACDSLAEQYYLQVLENVPNFLEGIFNIAFFYIKQKNFVKAKNYLEQYLEIANNDRKKHASKIKKAKQALQNIANHNLDDDLFKSAYDSIMQGAEEQGLKTIRQYLEKNPKIWNAWFLAGWALRRLERWEQAEEAFEKCIECGGQNSDVYNEIAISQMEQNKYDIAQENLLKALSLEPENTKVMSNLGFLNLRQNKYAEAKSFFETVLAFDEHDVIAQKALKSLDL